LAEALEPKRETLATTVLSRKSKAGAKLGNPLTTAR
jgi:hypothetical protein